MYFYTDAKIDWFFSDHKKKGYCGISRHTQPQAIDWQRGGTKNWMIEAAAADSTGRATASGKRWLAIAFSCRDWKICFIVLYIYMWVCNRNV